MWRQEKLLCWLRMDGDGGQEEARGREREREERGGCLTGRFRCLAEGNLQC